jgi:hypothetical protein
MKRVLYEKALAESERSLPEVMRAMPENVRKAHVKEIVDRASGKVIYFHKQGVTDLALLVYVSQATAEEMVRDITMAT